MYIDSHCHLDCIDLKDFDNSFEQLLDEIKASQVERMLCVSINLEDYAPMRKLIEPYSFIDVSEEDWFSYDVSKLKSQGYVSGFLDGSFRPNNNISVEEFITITINVVGESEAPVNKIIVSYIQ